MHRLDLSSYSHLKEFNGLESEPMLTLREKSSLPEAHRRVEPTMLHHALCDTWYSMHSTIQVCHAVTSAQDQNGVSLLYIMLEIHHSGREPSIYTRP